MISEISLAVSYIVGPLYSNLPRRRVDDFGIELEKLLVTKITPYWYPDQPFVGMHQRCVRVNGPHADPLVMVAATKAGLNSDEVMALLPRDQMKVWIDPGEVSYQVGDSLSEIKYLLRRNSDSSHGDGVGTGMRATGPQFFTVSAFARTKFGSTKLKHQSERPCTLGVPRDPYSPDPATPSPCPSDNGPLNIPCCLPWTLDSILTINIPNLKPLLPQPNNEPSEAGSLASELNSPVYGY